MLLQKMHTQQQLMHLIMLIQSHSNATPQTEIPCANIYFPRWVLYVCTNHLIMLVAPWVNMPLLFAYPFFSNKGFPLLLLFVLIAPYLSITLLLMVVIGSLVLSLTLLSILIYEGGSKFPLSGGKFVRLSKYIVKLCPLVWLHQKQLLLCRPLFSCFVSVALLSTINGGIYEGGSKFSISGTTFFASLWSTIELCTPIWSFQKIHSSACLHSCITFLLYYPLLVMAERE